MRSQAGSAHRLWSSTVGPECAPRWRAKPALAGADRRDSLGRVCRSVGRSTSLWQADVFRRGRPRRAVVLVARTPPWCIRRHSVPLGHGKLHCGEAGRRALERRARQLWRCLRTRPRPAPLWGASPTVGRRRRRAECDCARHHGGGPASTPFVRSDKPAQRPR